MKYIKIHKYLLLAFAGFVAYKSVTRGYRFVAERFAPREIHIVCKDIYSDELRCEIKQSIIRYLSGRSYVDVSLDELHKNLKQYFKLIKKISWNWRSWNEAELVVEGTRPLCVVNDIFVLGEKRRLFPTVFFTDQSCKSLPLVSLHFSFCGIKVPRYVHRFLQNVPKAYWERYKISYHDRDRITLKDKECSLPVDFVVNEHVFFDEKKLNQARCLYDDVLRRKKLTRSTRKRKVIYDLRFNNRIYAKIVRRT